MALKQTTDATFQQDVIENSKLTIVDFWAPWCGPCRQLMPVFEAVAAENDDVDFVKMNIDENPETPTSAGVRSLPTLYIYKDGKPVDAKSGQMSLDDLQAWVDQHAK